MTLDELKCYVIKFLDLNNIKGYSIRKNNRKNCVDVYFGDYFLLNSKKSIRKLSDGNYYSGNFETAYKEVYPIYREDVDEMLELIVISKKLK